jgi:hypothetical protein
MQTPCQRDITSNLSENKDNSQIVFLIDADLIIQTSCTASSLALLQLAGTVVQRHSTYLHGNANEVANWRSKNPLRRSLDFTAGLRTFAKQGGKVLVYEAQHSRATAQRKRLVARQKISACVRAHILEEEQKLCKSNRTARLEIQSE